MAIIYIIIGFSIFIAAINEETSPVFLVLWLILGVILLIFTPMKYALVFTALFGIGGDWFSDTGSAAGADIGSDLTVSSTIDSTAIQSSMEDPGVHTVEAHFVEGYYREDGTYVEGYWRDGDGNPNLDSTTSYVRSNPDGNPLNNIGKK